MGSDPLKDEWEAERARVSFRSRGSTGKKIAAIVGFIAGSVALSVAIALVFDPNTIEARACIAGVWILFCLGLGSAWRRIGR